MDNLPTVVTTSLEVFAKSGQLGPVNLGCSRQEVAELIGPPTSVSKGLVSHCSDVWMYGHVGLYFENERLYLIHLEDFDTVPAGGGRLRLLPWVLRRGLSIESLQQALTTASVQFKTERDQMSEACVTVVTSAGVYFRVQVDGESEELGLWLFGRRGN